MSLFDRRNNKETNDLLHESQNFSQCSILLPSGEQHDNAPRSPCQTCGGIVWAIPLYDPRPIDQAAYQCEECHPSAARAPRRRVMLFAGDGADESPVAVQVGRDLRPVDQQPVSAATPPANQGSGETAEQLLDLREWRSWETPDGLTTIHSRAWHQRGVIGGACRPPDRNETLDDWFSRLKILTDEVDDG